MNTTTIAALQIQLQEVLSVVSNIQTQIKTLTEAEEFDVFMLNEMTPYFGEVTSRGIIKTLQLCRNDDHNYLRFAGVYQWKSVKGNLEKRQLLKLISATYRVKYSRNKPLVYSLRSEIKYAKACPECGKLASAFYDRLVKEGKI
jgi:transcriptional regulator NrdR family protein